jgi:hypothetical protein
MEGSISLIATLMPALEAVQYVTINPSIKSPIGRTVLTPSYARFTTGVWTRRWGRVLLPGAAAACFALPAPRCCSGAAAPARQLSL